MISVYIKLCILSSTTGKEKPGYFKVTETNSSDELLAEQVRVQAIARPISHTQTFTWTLRKRLDFPSQSTSCLQRLSELLFAIVKMLGYCLLSLTWHLTRRIQATILCRVRLQLP